MKDAGNGDPEVMYQLARIYRDGTMSSSGVEVVKKDPQKALEWAQKAIESKGVIGTLAKERLREVARASLIEKMPRLSPKEIADVYYEGKNIPRDYDIALKYYKQMVAGIPENFDFKNPWNGGLNRMYLESMSRMGDIYRAKRNTEEFLRWKKMAVENGDKLASGDLGRYYQRLCTSYSRYTGDKRAAAQEAIKWIQLSELGRDCYEIGVIYESGLGVEVDEREAIKWYQKGAAKGNEQCKRTLKSIADKKEAQRRRSEDIRQRGIAAASQYASERTTTIGENQQQQAPEAPKKWRIEWSSQYLYNRNAMWSEAGDSRRNGQYFDGRVFDTERQAQEYLDSHYQWCEANGYTGGIYSVSGMGKPVQFDPNKR